MAANIHQPYYYHNCKNKPQAAKNQYKTFKMIQKISPFTPSKDPVAIAIQESMQNSSIKHYYISHPLPLYYDVFIPTNAPHVATNDALRALLKSNTKLDVGLRRTAGKKINSMIIEIHACTL